MEIKVGIQHVNREIVVETNETAADVEKELLSSIGTGRRWRLHGHRRARPQGADSRGQDRLRRPRRGERPPRRLRLVESICVDRGVATGWSGLEAELGHPLGVVLHQPGEHPADRGEVHARPVDGPGQQAGQRVPVRGHPLRLAERLADQPPAPQRQPARQLAGRPRCAARTLSTTKSTCASSASTSCTSARVSASTNAATSR